MNYTKAFLEALKKQDELNTHINKNWKFMNFPQHRAMWTEAAEMAESYHWYWWKDLTKEPDFENIKIEIVDIFHFLLSQYIQVFKNPNEIANYFNSRIHHLEKYEKEAKEIQKLIIQVQKEKILYVVDEFVSKVADRTKPVSIILFYKLMAYGNLTIDELFKKYFGKCVLNKFRQDNGYKVAKYSLSNYKNDGYLKEWEQGVEDNVFMLEFIKDLNIKNVNDFMKTLTDRLDEKYQITIKQIILS